MLKGELMTKKPTSAFTTEDGVYRCIDTYSYESDKWNVEIVPNAKVLIAAPTSKRHDYVIDQWIKQIKKQTFVNYDVLVVDTTPVDVNNKRMVKRLERAGIRVLHMPHDGTKRHIIQHLADARELIRQEFLKGSYTHLFFVDSDILLNPRALERLISHDKDQVGFPVHIGNYPGILNPAVFKSGFISMENGLDIYSWTEILKMYPNLVKVYANAMGCLLIKRKVLESVQFRTHPTLMLGEDLWFFAEADEKGFEAWCDTSYRPEHRNVNPDKIIFSWSEPEIQSKVFTNQRVFLGIGPEDAKEAVMCGGKNYVGQ